MAGLSAGIAQGARGFLNQAGSDGGGFLNSVLENLAGGGEPEYRGRSSGASYSSAGGVKRAASTAGAGSSTHRPPSHQEY